MTAKVFFGVWPDNYTNYTALENAVYTSGSQKFWYFRGKGSEGQMAGDNPDITVGPRPTASDVDQYNPSDLQAAQDGHHLGLTMQPKGGTASARNGIRYVDIIAGTWNSVIDAFCNQIKALPNYPNSFHIFTFHLEANIQKANGTTSQPFNGDFGNNIDEYKAHWFASGTYTQAWNRLGDEFTACHEYVYNRVVNINGINNLYWGVSLTRQAYDGTFTGGVSADVTRWFPPHYDWLLVDGYSKPKDGAYNEVTDIMDSVRTLAEARGKKVFAFATGTEEDPNNVNYKSTWFNNWATYANAHPTSVAGVVIEHAQDIDNGVLRYWWVDSVLPVGPNRSASGASMAAFRTLANNAIFADQAVKTLSDWESELSRGLEVHLTSLRVSTQTGPTDTFILGGAEANDLTDAAPGTPYGARHVIPMKLIYGAGLGAAGNYVGFNLGWKNIADDIIPGACTDPNGGTWAAWTEAPSTWITRNLADNVRALAGPVLIGIPFSINDLAVHKSSWVKQGGLASDVTIATAIAAYTKIANLIRAADNANPLKNLAGIVLWLDSGIYNDSDPANTFAIWSAMSPSLVDYLGVGIINDYNASGNWTPFYQDYQYVLKHAHEMNKPLIIEVGSQPDPGAPAHRATYFDNMRQDIEGVTVFPNGEQTAAGDVEAVILRLTEASGTLTYAIDLRDATAGTPDPAAKTMVLDIVNDASLTPQPGAGGLDINRADAGALKTERVVISKSVAGMLYDSGIVYDTTALYDGSPVSTTEVFTADRGVGTDASVPPSTNKNVFDSGSGSEAPSKVTTSGNQSFNVNDGAAGTEPTSTVLKGGNQSIGTSDLANAFDLVTRLDKVGLPPPATVYDTLYVADAADPAYPWAPTQVYIDLNANASGNGYGWLYEAEINLGRRTVTDTFIVQAPFPGAELAQGEQDMVDATIPLLGVFPDTDTMLSEYRKLAAVLDSDSAVLVWKPRGATETLYIDVVRSDIPSLLEGQDRAAHRALGLKLVLDLPLNLRCQPRLRKKPATPVTASLSMRTGQRVVRVTNPGNTRSLAKVRVKPRTGSHLVQARVSGYQGPSLAAFTKFEDALGVGDLGTLGDTDGDLSGATVAESSSSWTTNVLHTTIDTTRKANFQRRFSALFTTGAVTDALQGLYRVRMVVSMNHPMKFQMRYGLAQAVKSGTFIPEVEVAREGFTIDPGAATGTLVEVDFGVISVPEGTKFVQVEGFAGTTDDVPASNAFHVLWYGISLLPLALPEVTLSVPGFRPGGARIDDTWSWNQGELGRDATSPQVPSDVRTTPDAIVMNNTGEVAFVRPSGGMALASGRHRFTFSGSIYDADHDDPGSTYPPGRQMCAVEILDLSATSVPDHTNPPAGAIGGRQKIPGSRSGRLNTNFSTFIEFDSIDGHLYLPQFRFVKPFNSGRSVSAYSISHSVMRTVDFGSQMVLDGWSRGASMRSSSDQRLLGLANTGFIDLMPGDQDLVFSFWEVPALDDYYTMDDREPLGVIALGATYDVEVDVIPCVVAM